VPQHSTVWYCVPVLILQAIRRPGSSLHYTDGTLCSVCGWFYKLPPGPALGARRYPHTLYIVCWREWYHVSIASLAIRVFFDLTSATRLTVVRGVLYAATADSSHRRSNTCRTSARSLAAWHNFTS